MKVFNAKQATQDYMSTHTLAFSTPDLTLTRYSFWLGDMVPDPLKKEQSVPRIMTFIEEKDFQPVQIIDDEKFEPTGAIRVSGMYGSPQTDAGSNTKFCSECGSKISSSAKFCTDCGSTQD